MVSVYPNGLSWTPDNVQGVTFITIIEGVVIAVNAPPPQPVAKY